VIRGFPRFHGDPFPAPSVVESHHTNPRLVVGPISGCSDPLFPSENLKSASCSRSVCFGDSEMGIKFTGLARDQYRFFSIAFVTNSNQTSAPDTGIMDELRHDQFSFRSQSLVCRRRGQLFQGALQFTGLSSESPKHSQLCSICLFFGLAPRNERSWTSRKPQHALRRGEWSASRIDERGPLARQHPAQQTRDVEQ
jgi:hypothetical protein